MPQLGTGDSSVACVGAGPILVMAREMSFMQNGATVTPTTHKTYTYVVSMEKYWRKIFTAVLVYLLLDCENVKQIQF